jgi:hypothetical protein
LQPVGRGRLALLGQSTNWLREPADAAPICFLSDVDLDSDAGVTVALQLISISVWTLTIGSECPFDMRFQRPDNSHPRKQHGPAIFSGINEHLDG